MASRDDDVIAFDYDKGEIHRTYASGRALRSEQLRFWPEILKQELADLSIGRAVDLGCGIGRFSPMLRDVAGGTVYGVDRSERMLAGAIANAEAHGTRWIRAEADALPIRTGSVDLVFMFLVYHHLTDRVAALREDARVLSPGGVVLIVTSTVETLDSYLWVPFFPSARAIDRARLPSRPDLIRQADDAGLALWNHRTVMNPVGPYPPSGA